ncbi:LysR family transcriptional regulator [Undibacterium sp. Jales W-56]|uniref:LysR family transcriptional regulator n=1 Tax=Undibacterium sp. Jales W-56 TaxID=2897325 RepID=UPI0021D19796|nr:LysR family transcriptional regulator [Undibacterium sp. Jales W-56]MCU6432385.1 LysR family transcriptional regulator [Undibacterium sp. Jales W-56]
MQIYVRVAELASFTQAADSLGLPKASISIAIKQLESLLGTRLLNRTTRTVQMTQDGVLFYERSKDMLADMDELQAMFQQGEGEISGRLRIDLPIGVARYILIPRLPEFLQGLPKLEIEISSTDRRVDLVREGFDCVMRIGALSSLGESALIARQLGELRQINCASPDYLARFGTPQSLEDLRQHRLIHYTSNFGGKPVGFEYVENGQNKTQKMSGSITVNNSDAYQAACLAGFGIIQVPVIGMQRELIAAGRLVEILPAYTAQAMPVSLLYANRRHLPKRTQRLMNWIAEVMAAYLMTSSD